MSVLARPDGTVTASAFAPERIAASVRQIRDHAHIVTGPTGRELGLVTGPRPPGDVVGTLPPLYPEWLGGRTFCEAHGVRFPYVAGEMANGIATTRMVVAMARAEMLGFFGAGGLGLTEVETAVRELAAELGGMPNWGVNLIHSPNEPGLEHRVARLLLRHSVPCVSASAYMDLTPAVVLCSAAGLRSDPDGRILRRTRIFAKVSRPEVAARFLSPAPPGLLRPLVESGELTAEEAALAVRVPVAEDLTVEADSGGHTDNRPLAALLPRILGLREETARHFGYTRAVRIGAAGGLGTPDGVAAAFALGAEYVVTGSVNQVAVEAGLSDDAKAMLAEADIADVIMAPSADMFEAGVRLQVLRRGTLFAQRAGHLYEAYRAHPSLEALPTQLRTKLERDVFRAPVDEVWALTRRFWQERDPSEADRAERDPRHRMALVFRWYLGNSSRWAITGDSARRGDYQIWCGPAMGAFNRWTADSFLADPAERTVVQIALNLLEGAAVATRAHQLRTYGVPVPPSASAFTPCRLA
ncbi:PfaD family polyunsaturated fatty acid/polyketide biosynthesis protein [Streptomyces sp. JH34]|uniref:PfaD family polyunsaturated fatty acid/polyketide biosynthesis protein n=1 Tax=Streptomyces sp. JH34 TaxID=2793633 RepID=UPI0023F9AB80|nr:PfaD family polyunsaturated fatty acid/polyketide biosynthesis protein [Streptomyces sp. JH34]MDF6022580.1 PfaD family polyunsaturated fatty acid/polyketide biosynthesis protein [Streptomyces sp. JH34]